MTKAWQQNLKCDGIGRRDIAEWKKGAALLTIKFFKQVKANDKRIASRYDGITGGSCLLLVASIDADGEITAEDIEGFTEETKAVLNMWARVSKK